MADERRRDLERRAAAGDPEARARLKTEWARADGAWVEVVRQQAISGFWAVNHAHHFKVEGQGLVDVCFVLKYDEAEPCLVRRWKRVPAGDGKVYVVRFIIENIGIAKRSDAAPRVIESRGSIVGRGSSKTKWAGGFIVDAASEGAEFLPEVSEPLAPEPDPEVNPFDGEVVWPADMAPPLPEPGQPPPAPLPEALGDVEEGDADELPPT